MPVYTRRALEAIAPYVAGKRIAEVKKELGIEDIVKLASNEYPFGPFEKAKKAMVDTLDTLNRYPDGAVVKLREKLSRRLGFPIEQIAVGNGSNELERLLMQVVAEPGDNIVYGWPSFIVYPLIAKLFGVEARAVPLDIDMRHELQAMAGAVDAKTKVVMVCNPNNPTGTIVTRDDVLAFVDKIPESVIIAFDEAYFEFVQDENFLSGMELFAGRPNIVVFRTFSKIYGLAGTRIGYCVAPAEIVEAMAKVREPFNVNSVAQAGAYFSLDCDDELAVRKEFITGQKEFLYQELDRLGVTYVRSEANFIYIDTGMDAMVAFDKLQRQGLIVRAFGGGTWVRVTVGSEEENRRLIAALDDLRKSGGS